MNLPHFFQHPEPEKQEEFNLIPDLVSPTPEETEKQKHLSSSSFFKVNKNIEEEETVHNKNLVESANNQPTSFSQDLFEVFKKPEDSPSVIKEMP